MAIIQAVLALVSRSLGRIVSAIFGWAVVALFGQTNGAEKAWLSALVAAAAAWPILLLGIAVPKLAVFALSFVPIPGWIPPWTIRTVWIVLAATVPLAIGVTMAARRRKVGEPESALMRLWRGVPVTIGIAGAFLVVFATVPALRLASLIKRKIDVHVPLVTDGPSYPAVAARVARTLGAHGFDVDPARPPWWMTAPSSILLALGGPAFRDYIPERLAYFRGPRLEVALYPNALLVRGAAQDTAWAHGVIVERLTDAPAFQTFDPGAQAIERQIRRIWSVYRENPAAHTKSAALRSRFGDVARDIARLPVPYDEWQIVYRQALQLGRALDGHAQVLEPLATHDGRAADGAAQEDGFMTTTRNGEPVQSLSNRALISEITGKATTLARKEIELAKAEIRADLAAELGMVKTIGAGAVAALLGVNGLLVAGILALALVMPGWAAGLIVGGVLLGIGAILGYVGWRRHVTTPLARTRQTLREDMQWVKERVA